MKTINPQIHATQQTSHKKLEENYTETQHNQLLKISDKENILKTAREKKTPYIHRNKGYQILHRKQYKGEESVATSLEY